MRSLRALVQNSPLWQRAEELTFVYDQDFALNLAQARDASWSSNQMRGIVVDTEPEKDRVLNSREFLTGVLRVSAWSCIWYS